MRLNVKIRCKESRWTRKIVCVSCSLWVFLKHLSKAFSLKSTDSLTSRVNYLVALKVCLGQRSSPVQSSQKRLTEVVSKLAIRTFELSFCATLLPRNFLV